jgi:hypothetical protein
MTLKLLMLGTDDLIICINFSEKNKREDFKYDKETPECWVFIKKSCTRHETQRKKVNSRDRIRYHHYYPSARNLVVSF